jgi:cbb3-type cytochrome oxidase subunit 3
MDLVAIYPALKSFWTVWLVLLFAFLVFRALKPSRRAEFGQAAAIPLRDDAFNDDKRRE